MSPVALSRFGGSALVLTTGLGAYLGEGNPERAAWRGGILFDEDARNGLRITSLEGQEAARKVSDIFLIASMLNAAAIDATLTPLLQGDPHLAWQAQLAHSFALGVTLGAGSVVKQVVARARPYERECLQNPNHPACGNSDNYESFYSLHSGVAFTSAGFSCAMHLSRNLYGDAVSDILACGTSVAMATTTGLLRVVADRHYLSDVLVGAALGFLVGYLVPLAMVPERGSHHTAEQGDGTSWMIMPMLSAGQGGGSSVSGGIGISAAGTFY